MASVTVSFGLVSIPVKLYTPTKSDSSISFKQLGPNGERLKQQYISAETGEVVSRKDFVKGYEYSKDRFVVLTSEEIASAETEATRAIDNPGVRARR